MIFTMITSLCYTRFADALEREVERHYENTFSNEQFLFEQRLRDLEKIAVQIDSEYTFMPDYIGVSGYTVHAAVKKLDTIYSCNTFIDGLGFCPLADSGMRVYTQSTSWDLGEYLKAEGFQAEEIETRLKTIIKPTLISDISSRGYLYVYPLPMEASSPHSYVFFVITKATIDEFFRTSLEGEGDDVLISEGKNGATVYISHSSDASELLGEDSGMLTRVGETIYMTIDSEYNGWQYTWRMNASEHLSSPGEYETGVFRGTIHSTSAYRRRMRLR